MFFATGGVVFFPLPPEGSPNMADMSDREYRCRLRYNSLYCHFVLDHVLKLVVDAADLEWGGE